MYRHCEEERRSNPEKKRQFEMYPRATEIFSVINKKIVHLQSLKAEIFD